MPDPSPNESMEMFMDRCMSFPDMQQYAPSQRAAICHSKWENRGKKMMITKHYEIKDLKDRTLTLLASDESVDRDGDIILSTAWDVANFMKTGAILYGHDKDKPPVAKPLDTLISQKQLLVNAKFADAGTSEWTDSIYSLVEQGILKGISVGFRGLEFQPNEHNGKTFTKCELIEVSLTPVPSNANARVLLKHFSQEIQDALLNDKDNKDETPESTQAPDKVAEPEKVDEDAKEFLNIVSKLKNIIGE